MLTLADIPFPSYELLELAKRAQRDIHAIESVLIWSAIPLALLPPIPIAWRWVLLRMLVITLGVWGLLIAFRITYEVPWNKIVLNIEQRENGYDGVGGNAVLVLLGWLVPLFESFFTLCVARGILLILKFRKTSSATEVANT